MKKEDAKEGDMLRTMDNWVFIHDSFAPTPLFNSDNVILYKAAMHLLEDNTVTYVSIPLQPSCGLGHFSEARNIRHTTNYEKEIFYDELRIRGFVYNEETKRVEKIQ